MADSIIDWVQPSGVGGINTVAKDQTGPVGQSELGRNPQIAGGLPFEPPWQPTPGDGGVSVGTPGFSAHAAFGKEAIFDTVAIPVAPPAVTLDGAGFICPGFEDVLYGRIHLIPKRIDLGNVLQDQAFDVEVWNAFDVSRTLDSIGAVDAEGLVVLSPTPPGAPPAVFPPLSSFIYQVTVTDEGPATIGAQFTFDFTIEAPVLSVTGTRIVTLAFCPQRPIMEALEWKTDVIESYNGDEQRIRGRNLPRQLFEMEYFETENNARSRLLNHLIGFAGKFYAVPVWHFGRPLLQDAASSATIIFVDTTNADFRDSTPKVQSLVILWRSETDFEIAQVAVGGLAAGQITLERPLENAHSAALTEVIPIQVMLARDPVEWALTPNGALTVDIKWLAEEVVDLAEIDGNLTLFNGRPVLTGFNYVDETLAEKITEKYELFDSESGTFQPLERRTVPEYATQKGFETATPADSWDLRKLIYALRGKQRSFYMPTWRSDFVATDTIGSSDLNITVEEADHARFINGIEPFAALMVLLNDGTQLFRNITGIAPGSPGEELVSIDVSLGQTVTVAEIRHISYLLLARLGSDRVIFRHRFKDVVSVRIPVIGVKQ